MAFPRPDTVVDSIDGSDLIPIQVVDDLDDRTDGSVDTQWYITFDDLVAAVVAVTDDLYEPQA